MCGHVFLDEIMHRQIKIVRLLQSVSRLAESLGNNRIQGCIGACNRVRRTYHTELKLISRKRKRRSSVSVRRILLKIRQRRYTRFKLSALLYLCRISCLHKLTHHVL